MVLQEVARVLKGKSLDLHQQSIISGQDQCTGLVVSLLGVLLIR